MPRTITFETVAQIGLSLPGVEKSVAYWMPTLKVHGQLLACIPANPSAEPGSLTVRVDFDDRADLLAGDPDAYYLPDHYVNYSAVLARLSRVDRGKLRDLLRMAYKFVTRQRKPVRENEAPITETSSLALRDLALPTVHCKRGRAIPKRHGPKKLIRFIDCSLVLVA